MAEWKRYLYTGKEAGQVVYCIIREGSVNRGKLYVAVVAQHQQWFNLLAGHGLKVTKSHPRFALLLWL